MVKRRIIHAARQSIPSRESLAENRFIKPVAHRVLAPELWRFTRRSVLALVHYCQSTVF